MSNKQPYKMWSEFQFVTDSQSRLSWHDFFFVAAGFYVQVFDDS